MDREPTALKYDPKAPNEAIDVKRVIAGREYAEALIKLGFKATFICWAYVHETNSVELAIVTSAVEVIGPLRVYDLLFRAYDRSVLPKTVDPFEVSVYGPKSDRGQDLLQVLSTMAGLRDHVGLVTPEVLNMRMDWVIGIHQPITIPPYAVLYVDPALEFGQKVRDWWRRFERSVEATAA